MPSMARMVVTAEVSKVRKMCTQLISLLTLNVCLLLLLCFLFFFCFESISFIVANFHSFVNFLLAGFQTTCLRPIQFFFFFFFLFCCCCHPYEFRMIYVISHV